MVINIIYHLTFIYINTIIVIIIIVIMIHTLLLLIHFAHQHVTLYSSFSIVII
jgi:hypothetical protein